MGRDVHENRYMNCTRHLVVNKRRPGGAHISKTSIHCCYDASEKRTNVRQWTISKSGAAKLDTVDVAGTVVQHFDADGCGA